MENLERVPNIFVDVVEQTGYILTLESILLTASQILKSVTSTQVSNHDKVEVCISIIHWVATFTICPAKYTNGDTGSPNRLRSAGGLHCLFSLL